MGNEQTSVHQQVCSLLVSSFGLGGSIYRTAAFDRASANTKCLLLCTSKNYHTINSKVTLTQIQLFYTIINLLNEIMDVQKLTIFQTELSHSPSLKAHFTIGVKLGSSIGSVSIDPIESTLLLLHEPGDLELLVSWNFVFTGVLGIVKLSNPSSASSASSNWPSSPPLRFFFGVWVLFGKSNVLFAFDCDFGTSEMKM